MHLKEHNSCSEFHVRVQSPNKYHPKVMAATSQSAYTFGHHVDFDANPDRNYTNYLRFAVIKIYLDNCTV